MVAMSLNHPIVSVVLPCYNAASTVAAAIESVANSSIASRCELIIVNDGSTDNSGGIIDAACKRTFGLKIVAIHTSNQGVSKARNTALGVSKGKYVAFLDADDRLSPCMLENMVEFSEASEADFAYCGLTSDPARLCEHTITPKPVSKDAVFSTLLYRSRSLSFFCVLYRRRTIEGRSLRFDESLRYGEDLAFLWKYALACSVFLHFDRPFYYYASDNQASAMHRICWEMTDVLAAVEGIRSHIPPTENALRESYDEYMVPRYLLYLQKCFAAGSDRELFDRLRREHAPTSFRAVIRKARPAVSVSAMLYSVSPRLYYRLFQALG